MSCSQFIEHEEDKSDTLVIIVNGDGTVTVDPHTFEKVLNQQCRAAVSVIKIEDSNEPDSQTEQTNSDQDDKSSEDKDSFCHKVNLVVEGYYPAPPLNMANKPNTSPDAIVSSTVGTPTLPQTSADFLDLLSEGLEIPDGQINPPTSSTEGCIGDSLVDAFSEMAPEQLKQVETALHSEKAKQILGDDVTTVLDTLKMNEENDDWVHFDHCYTNFYGNKKNGPLPERRENVTVQNSEEATMFTFKINSDDELNSIDVEDHENKSSQHVVSKVVKTVEANESDKLLKKKGTPIRPKVTDSDNNISLVKRSLPENMRNAFSVAKDKRSVHVISKVKRKSTPKSEQPEQVPQRIVKDDEVDGVKVFKPTRNDKRLMKPFLFTKDSITTPKNQLIQSKLNFTRKEEPRSVEHSKLINKPEIQHSNSTCDSAPLVNAKKDATSKQTGGITLDTFGPALFSTPDIIKKINSDDPLKDVHANNDTPGKTGVALAGCRIEVSKTSSNKSIQNSTVCQQDHAYNVLVDESTDIEKRMSAIENGEALLDRIHMQFEMKNKEKYTSLSDEERLLSDLENTDDEMNVDEHESRSSNSKMRNFGELNLDNSSRKSSSVDKSENSDKDDVDYEDDPNKLWCLCNKPHGNRFMICCDACDNWFHGSCVGVTRQMGEKMELNGTEWLCPSCRKEKNAKEREARLQLGTRSVTNRQASRQNISNSTADGLVKLTPVTTDRTSSQATSVRRKSSSQLSKPIPSQICIECKLHEAIPNTLYCSNICIVRHVSNSVAAMNDGQDQPLPDEQKIIVVDKKKDHRITGMRAPSVGSLREWLLEHPSYEIVKPSAFPMSRPTLTAKEKPKPPESVKAYLVSKNKDTQNVVIKPNLVPKPKIETTTNSQLSLKQYFVPKPNEDMNASNVRKIEDGNGNIIIREGNVIRTIGSNVLKREVDLKVKDKQRQIKLIPVQPLLKQVEEPKSIPAIPKKPISLVPVLEKKKKVVEVTPKKEKQVIKKVEPARPELKKSVDEDSNSAEITSVAKGPEPVRANIRKSLTELFVSRAKDLTDLNPSESEVTALAIQVEEQLFNLFRDVGSKYKNKYRSLLFNLKDQKNNLFQRVVDKSLSTHELVRLTPEELASTELAQWRERETKHELEMIKKTELENLNQSKVLVVKTHKGELEIESQALPPSITDTVVPELQKEDIPNEKEKSKKPSVVLPSNKEKHSSLSRDKELHDKKDRDRDRDKDRHKKHDRKDRHKSSKHRRRSSERSSRHRSRSRRRSWSSARSRSAEKESRVKSDDKDGHRSRSKRRRSRSRSRRRKTRSVERKETSQMQENVEATSEPSQEMNESTTNEKSPFVSTEEEEKIAADLLNSYNSVDVDLSDMEPTSTVTIKTPPYEQSPETSSCVWKGTVVMPDVAKFQTVLKEVSGNCVGLDADLPPIIECVGRINPNTVWDYISKVKKSGHKEILVLRFEVQEEENRINYLSLYSYLSNKNRMAVIGNTGPNIKDFYAMTLASHSPVPQVLLPLDGPGFEDYRSHMLLAIIVRLRQGKSRGSSMSSSTSKAKKVLESETYAPTTSYDSFTPPHSPTSVLISNPVAEATISQNDEDEPYEPEDDEPYSPGELEEDCTSKSLKLQLEMEEINRKIEEEKQKIESLSSMPLNQTESTELYSPSDTFQNNITGDRNGEEDDEGESETSNVQLPEDLQQLLNSFAKRSSEPTTSVSLDPLVDVLKKVDEGVDKTTTESQLETTFSSSKPAEGELESKRESEKEPERDGDSVLESSVQESAEDSKTNRDPRIKSTTEGFLPTVTQPPPPGMEDEFTVPVASTTASTISDTALAASLVSDAAYAVSMAGAHYAYPTAPAVPPFPPNMMPPHPQMYMPSVYSQPGALPYAAIPPPQMYVPPPVLHCDPSVMPLPTDTSDKLNPLKRKAPDELEKEGERDMGDRLSRRSDSRNRKPYYSDSKSRRSDSRSPPRHKGSSGYDPHHRGYQRDDVEYSNSGHSRYGHNKYGRNYPNRRNSYWKGGNDYNSGHRKYTDSRSRRSNSRERGSRRYDSSKDD